MTALATVVGAQGFIGRHLLTHLQGLGWQAQASPRQPDPAWWDRPLGTVFYCAGLTADFARRPHDAVAAHVCLLNEVLRQDRFDSLVYLSSTRLYDSAAAGQAVHEDSPLLLNPALPRHLFDLSKSLGESLCRQASGGRARIARLSCVVAGPGEESGFVGQLLGRVQRARQQGQSELSVDTSAHLERDYIHIDDVLDALLRIASQGTQAAYNVAAGVNTSNAQLLASLQALSGVRLRALHDQLCDPPACVSTQRLQRELGWHATPLLQRLPQLLALEQPCCA